MQRIRHLIRWVCIGLGCLVLLLMVGQITGDVLLRLTGRAGIFATPEIVAYYFMVMVTFLPLALAQIEGRHIDSAVLESRLPSSVRRTLGIVACLIGIGVYAAMLKASYDDALRQSLRGAYVNVGVARFPTWPSYWILPVSLALMLLVLVMELVGLIVSRRVQAPGEHV